AMLEAAMEGNLDTLYVVGEDIAGLFPDATFAEIALRKTGYLVVQDSFMTETAKMADLVLPSGEFTEKRGTLTNQEGRVHNIGALLSPPGEARTDHEIFYELGSALINGFEGEDAESVFEKIKNNIKSYSHIDMDFSQNEEKCGCMITKGNGNELTMGTLVEETHELKGGGSFTLMTGNHLLHSGRLSSNSEILNSLSGEATVEISAEDGEGLGVSPGDKVVVSGNGFEATVSVRIKNGSKSGVAFLPEHYTKAPANRFLERNSAMAQVTIRPA
ncbi:MAG: molybdopterin-dependent oxidoreductase, partial [Deltaproteobacteria bacterium]|nr:molybdopterin-dependent oxidoreductase [Deltaproteobacteria bacterium]